MFQNTGGVPNAPSPYKNTSERGVVILKNQIWKITRSLCAVFLAAGMTFASMPFAIHADETTEETTIASVTEEITTEETTAETTTEETTTEETTAETTTEETTTEETTAETTTEETTTEETTAEDGSLRRWADDGFSIRAHDGRIYIFGITAVGANLDAAIKRAYEGVDMVSFTDCHFRKDIGIKKY